MSTATLGLGAEFEAVLEANRRLDAARVSRDAEGLQKALAGLQAAVLAADAAHRARATAADADMPEPWMPVFLAALRERPDVTMAADAAGINARTAYRHQKTSVAFAEAWQDALDRSIDGYRGRMHDTANGRIDPSPTQHDAAKWLMICHRPEVYHPKNRVELSGSLTLDDELLSRLRGLTPEQREEERLRLRGNRAPAGDDE